MPLDALVLGPFVFDTWATPEQLPLGGKHTFNTKKLMGGDRVIDAMGPDDDDRSFSGIHYGSTALADAQTLDALRIAGLPLPYSNGAEARTVVITSFTYEVEKFNVIHFKIDLMTVDNPAGDQSAPASVDSLASDDFASGSATVATNAASAYPVTTPIGSGGIGSA